MSAIQENGAEPQQANVRARFAWLPSGRILLIALTAGLFVSWWGSFHEVACGCIKLHSVMSLFYLKLGCYAFSLGSAAAGLLFLATGRRAARDGGAWLETARPGLLWIVAAVLVFFGSGFYISLATETLPLAILFLLLLHAACACICIAGVMALADLPLSDVAAGALVVLVCYALVDNALLPATVGATGSFFLVMSVQALVLVAVAALATMLLRDAGNRALLAKGTQLANQAQGPEPGVEGRRRVAPQPLLNLFAYYLVFGLMHVEASMRFGEYVHRNVPYIAGMLLAVGLFYITFMRRSSTMRIWPKVQSAVFTLTMAAFMLLPVISSTSSIVPVALIEAAYYYYDALFVLACLVIARETGFTLRTVLGLGFAVKGVAYFLGVIVCHLQMDFFGGSVIEQPVAILIVFVLLASVTLWMGDTIVAKKLWGMRIDRAPRHHADTRLIQERCDRLAQTYRLTPRESEVCAQLAAGAEIEDAAGALYISVQTLRTHIRNIYAKTDVHNRRDLVKLMESMDQE